MTYDNEEDWNGEHIDSHDGVELTANVRLGWLIGVIQWVPKMGGRGEICEGCARIQSDKGKENLLV